MPDFVDVEAMLDEYLDEVFGSFSIGGLEFLASDILKSCDPIAYRCAVADFESDLVDWNQYEEV